MDVEELFSVFNSSSKEVDSCNLESDAINNKRPLEEDTISQYIPKKRKLLIDGINFEEKIPKVTVLELSNDGCLHEVVIPKNKTFEPLVKKKVQAKDYPFKLDPFQSQSNLCIDSNHSVLVSAHTSAGKTVVAEYAIATALKNNQKVVYTTPIKALSNQKFGEFKKKFEDVGLMTGDVTNNETASCLVMTTEILRNMLYNGSSLIGEIGWVIFDEIHYMRDKARGVVWEETIILLPDQVRCVFLSATIPNAQQFASWIATTHNQFCHVVYTDYRPVPLQHFVFPTGGESLYLAIDEQGCLHKDGMTKALKAASEHDVGKNPNKKNQDKIAEDSIFRIIKTVQDNKLTPMIVFSFSRKDCEFYASKITQVDFNTEEEKTLVTQLYENAINILSDEDKKLPQVRKILPMIRQGIGIHHSGLLPIVKETIELLFGENLIKVLFATETFSMGLNMPAKAVLFTSLRKFDGHSFRWLSSGEFIQMSGRAGRRGLDDKGTIIAMIDNDMTSNNLTQILRGRSDVLNSTFHVTTNMILNLSRKSEYTSEYMMEHSFHHFQRLSALPKIQQQIEKMEGKKNSIQVPREEEVLEIFRRKKQEIYARQKLHSFYILPQNCLKFLYHGTLVKVFCKNSELAWAFVGKVKTKSSEDNKEDSYSVSVAVYCKKQHLISPTLDTIKPALETTKSKNVEILIFQIPLDQIANITLFNGRKSLPTNMKTKEFKDKALELFPVAIKGNPKFVDGVVHMKIKDSEYLVYRKRLSKALHSMKESDIAKDPSLMEYFEMLKNKTELQENINTRIVEMKNIVSLIQLEDLKARINSLCKLDFLNTEHVITIKGRVGCEISSANEIVLTEMIFSSMFNKLSVEHMIALLSCFVCEEDNKKMPPLPSELKDLLTQLQDKARMVASVCAECLVDIKEDTFVNNFQPTLMEISLAWANGKTFAEVSEMSKMFDGSIIRCFRRLVELIEQLHSAAKVIGNIELEKKFKEGIDLIKRDVVFTSSLYL